MFSKKIEGRRMNSYVYCCRMPLVGRSRRLQASQIPPPAAAPVRRRPLPRGSHLALIPYLTPLEPRDSPSPAPVLLTPVISASATIKIQRL